ncbi:transferase [Clostridium perfringens]|nr:transferase [Clostridium perfringens]
MKDLVIIGAGGVGQELTLIVEEINKKKEQWNLLGFIDDNKELHDNKVLGYKVLGGLNWLKKFVNERSRTDKREDINVLEKDYEDRKVLYVVVAIANYKIKKNIVESIKSIVKFATLIHPDIYIHKSNKVGEGTVIYPGTIITVDIRIGDHVIISPKCGIGHNSIIKDYVSLLWNVNVSGYDYIEEGVLMGSGSTIIQNKNIGQGAVIGAGSVVVKDIEAWKTVIGVPSKPIR